jgi:hypothetical protein
VGVGKQLQEMFQVGFLLLRHRKGERGLLVRNDEDVLSLETDNFYEDKMA